MESQDLKITAIKWAMGEFDLTQAAAGKMMGVVQSAVSQMLNKDRTIKPRHIKGLAKGVGITVDDMLYRSTRRGMYVSEKPAERTEPTDLVAERHRKLVNKFKQKDLALEINEELLDLEGLDHKKLLSVLDYVRYQKKLAAEEAQKKISNK
jgi:predicted transcriptional regulator